MSKAKRVKAAKSEAPEAAAPKSSQPSVRVKRSEDADKGALQKGADYLLSRLPWFKWRYMDWGVTKRVIIGYLMWLIVLPIIPLALMAILYVRDPEGFKKSPALPILTLITAAWFGGLGWVVNQTPVTDNTSFASVKEKADGESSADNSKPDAVPSKESKDKVAKQRDSKATGGRKFENCTAAFNAGVFDIKRTDPSYERRLDRDNDGIACEK